MRILVPWIGLIITTVACTQNGGASTEEGGSSHSMPAQGAPALPPGHPAVGAGMAPMPPTVAPSPAAAGEAKLLARGTVHLAAGLTAPAGSTLFLSARAPEAEGKGPPLIVSRFTASTLPLHFELTDKNLMMPGMPLPEKLVITAVVDQDGDAISKMPGDISGSSQPMPIGAEGADVELNVVQKEFKPGRPIQ